MEPKMFKATVSAFVILAILGFVSFGIVLADTWTEMQVSGVLRSGDDPVALSFYMLTLLLTTHLMGHMMTGFWFEKPRDGTKYAWQYGVAVGILWVIPQLSAYFFYNIPTMVPIVQLIYALVAFPIAATVFAKVYHQKK